VYFTLNDSSRYINFILFKFPTLSTSIEAFKYFYYIYYIKSILFMKTKYGVAMFKKYDQNQQFLLPVRLDSFVPEDHIARIINDIIDAVDQNNK